MGQVQVKVNNRQAIAVFVLGIALLLAAFWAGLNVVKQDTIPAVSQPDSENRPAESGKRRDAASTQTGEQNPQSSGYILQVAVFGTSEKAAELVAELRRKYKSAHTLNPTGDDTMYRVRIGPYTTREEADQVGDELAAQGMKGVMISPWP
jgi:cell division septation protein DedD